MTLSRTNSSLYRHVCVMVCRLLVVLLVVWLTACESPSRYSMEHDAGPSRSMDVQHIPDAVPRVEPRTYAGNKSPYKVLGKTYHVLSSPEGYKAEGLASWYGKKFHGHKTSNGEIYNMYGMTAAHKTLPIPSYVRVTNKSNGRSAIVRINDRGPFHGNRLIDLTYTAAKKLGFLDQGTAQVRVEYIDPKTYRTLASKSDSASARNSSASTEPKAPAPKHSGGYEIAANTYLQVGAFSQLAAAEELQSKLRHLTQYPVNIFAKEGDSLFRVRIGPLKDNLELLLLKHKLLQNSLPEAHIVYQ